MTAQEPPKYKPQELDEHPAVDALLKRLGFGPFRRDTVVAPVGRNDCWAGQAANGRKVFVKRLTGHEKDTANRMRRLRGFEHCATAFTSPALRGPAVLGFDEEARLVAFGYLENTRTGAELLIDQSFTPELSRQVGKAIGELHGTRPPEGVEFDRSLPAHPSPRVLRGMPLAMLEGLSFGEVQAWGLMQRDGQLIEAVERLLAEEAAAPKVPSHCDLRVDQLLVHDGGFVLTDWEEFRLADPARDVGSYLGEWLHRSVLDIVTPRGDLPGDRSVFLDQEFTHELVVTRGAEKLRRLQPLMRAFWHGYRSTTRPHEAGPDLARYATDSALARRATAFAGWHLLDRLLAGSQRSPRLSAIERAAAGVGRRALLSPERFAPALGLVHEETTWSS